MDIKINMNNIIKVKVTPFGHEIYNKHYQHSSLPSISLKVDDDGYSSFSIWNLMNIYGQYLELGRDVDNLSCQLPFLLDAIIITR